MLEPLTPAGGQDVIFPVSNPWSERGNHISILRGSLAPDGAVVMGVDARVTLTPPCIFCTEKDEWNVQGGVRMTLTSTPR